MSFFTKPRLIVWLLLASIAAALFLSYTVTPKTTRVLLYFQRSDGSIGTEERYLPQVPVKHFAVSLVEELLLGPTDHSFLRLCDPHLLPSCCFVRNGGVYIDVPAQILTPQVKTAGFHTAYRLLQKNIFTNCKDINAVYLYIDGVPAYINNTDRTADNKNS